MASFTDGKQRLATEEDLKACWGGIDNGFRCCFCGYKFKLGDKWRWQYTNDIKNAGGNPVVCAKCDEGIEKTREKWIEKCKRVKDLFENELWFFVERLKR